MVDMVWDTARMGLDMEAMEDMVAMEDTGPTTLARGLLILNPRLLLRLNQRLMPMPGMVAMDLDTEAMVDMDLDMLVDMEAMEAMDLDMLVDMEAMEDTGPTSLARGLLILNPRLRPIPGMADMVWDTVHMEDMLVDMEGMDTDVDIASMVER